MERDGMIEDLGTLLAKLGSTEKATREIVEIGEPALVPLDAIANDPSRPLHVRRAASAAAHHIRDRALHAPPREQVAAPEFAVNRFPTAAERTAFLDELARAGAVRVVPQDLATLVVELPGVAAERAAVFAIYNREVELCGESFGGESEERLDDSGHAVDVGQGDLVFWWD